MTHGQAGEACRFLASCDVGAAAVATLAPYRSSDGLALLWLFSTRSLELPRRSRRFAGSSGMSWCRSPLMKCHFLPYAVRTTVLGLSELVKTVRRVSTAWVIRLPPTRQLFRCDIDRRGFLKRRAA